MKASHSRLAATGAAVLSLFLMQSQTAKAGLLALYTFDQTLGDSSGNGLTATDSGTPTYVSGAPFGGDAISFDGSGNAIVTAPINISVANLPQVTFGAWVDALSITTPNYGIISNDDGDFDRTLDIDFRPDGCSGATPCWSAFAGDTAQAVGTVPVVTNQWVFVAVSYDQSSGPGTYTFYTNNGSGTTVLSGAADFDSDSVTTGTTIGRNPNFDQPFDGYVADAFFYNGILSGSQISSIIADGPSAIPGAGSAPEPSTLVFLGAGLAALTIGYRKRGRQVR